MRRSPRDKRVSRSLFSVWNFLAFFLLVAFLVTNCFLLFFTGLELSEEEIRRSAALTFLNVIGLSFLCTLVDGLRRKLTIERPVKRILTATRKLTEGDFTARIQPLRTLGPKNEFDILIDDFNLMAGELAGTETLRTDFIANVSHELKTPLAAIQNYATLLQSPALPEAQRMEYAKTIGDSTRRLTSLITNILKMSKLENQQIYPVPTEYDLGEQLCECLLQFEGVWEQKSLDIQSEIGENVVVCADPELLSLVWNNLFSNAFKFTPAGGTVTVRLTEAGDRAVVSVADTGCGMDAETGRHIFEKFYQGDRSHATQGNGLGLALVKRVIDILGGEISVESAPGAGSTFTVKLRKRADEKLS